MASLHSSVLLEADGGSRGNPGPAGFGALIRDADTGEVIAQVAESIGRASNNVAEYRGLIGGLELYAEHTPDALLEVRMDSKLVIEQMAGRWKVKHANMRPLAVAAQRLAPFGTVWTWVPRELNSAADRLANLAMDAAKRGEVFDVRTAGGSQSADPTPEAMEPVEPGAAEPVLAGRAPNPMVGWRETDRQPTTIVFLRHGETKHTAAKKFSGPGGDDPGLNPIGREQSQRAANALAADGGFDVLISSPLRRTRETAEIVSEALDLPMEIVAGFRECAFGDWDGYTLSEVEERWPADLRSWLESMAFAPPGGESMIAVRERVEKTLIETLSTYAGKKVVVVSHVNPIKLAVRYCLDAPLESLHRMLLAPASLTTLSFYDSGACVLRQFSAVP